MTAEIRASVVIERIRHLQAELRTDLGSISRKAMELSSSLRELIDLLYRDDFREVSTVACHNREGMWVVFATRDPGDRHYVQRIVHSDEIRAFPCFQPPEAHETDHVQQS